MENRRIKALFRKSISMLLAVMMLFNMTEGAFAYMVQNAHTAQEAIAAGQKVVITDSSGNETTPDESWTTTFPYGTFAFQKASLSSAEGESSVIRVYRLGGTTGRATAYITYEPVVTKSEDGSAIYENAISANDVNISVEEPQPIAKYQKIGKDPDPEAGTAKVVSAKDSAGYTLSLSESADSYRWQILSDGVWADVEKADGATLAMDADFIEGGKYDYRCVYTTGGVSYCTASLNGTAYVKPAEEEVEPMPGGGVEVNADPVYTPLDLRGEGEDPYNGWAFELIFADSEWVKEIHIDALTDDLSESEELAKFTIRDCEGGSVYDTANTLLYHISDANEAEPSTLGFAVNAVKVDKAAGKASVTIERVGGNQSAVSVEYATADGTAVAGKDYTASSGTVMFYAGLKKNTIDIPLIDDGTVSEDAGSFQVKLSNLLGGSGSCTLTQDTATVSLYNSGTGDGTGFASQVYDAQAVDVSDSVTEAGSAAAAENETVTGTSVKVDEPADVASSLVPVDGLGDAELTAQLHQYTNSNGSLKAISFANPSSPWGATIDIASSKDYWTITSDAQKSSKLYGSGEETGKLGSGSTLKLTSGVALTSKNSAAAQLSSSGYTALGSSKSTLAQMFTSYNTNFRVDCAHDTASYTGWFDYYYSYTFPQFRFYSDNAIYTRSPSYIKRFGAGPFDADWRIKTSLTGGEDESHYYNPNNINLAYGNIPLTGSDSFFDLSLDYYDDYNKNTHDTLNDYSMVWLKDLVMRRRTFSNNAFFMEISTPNDSDTAPDNCATIGSDLYTQLEPSVAITSGGTNGSNGLFVGSSLKITPASAPTAFELADGGLLVYQSTDGGKTWNIFNKFAFTYSPASTDSNGNVTSRACYTGQLVGNASNALTSADLTALYKFRLRYTRSNTITVDLSPSVPRLSTDTTGQTIDTSKASEAWSTFSAVKTNISYGVSEGYDSNKNYTKTITSKTQTVPAYSSNLLAIKSNASATWSFRTTNLQWINFNRSADDIILFNGRAYPGNATIYLTAADLTTGLTFRYYSKEYQSAKSAMTPTILSTGVYYDANGNGMIDGYYNTTEGVFHLYTAAELAAQKASVTTPDEFSGYYNDGKYDETQFAPTAGSDGKYREYFFKITYDMTPRCLTVPVDGKSTDRAQVMPAFVSGLNVDSSGYAQQTAEQKAYRYIVSGKTTSVKDAAAARSSDGHVMYGAEASAKSTVDIPLGGDFTPAHVENGGYVWSPTFYGNLLYPFSNPEPITIKNSLAGVTPITRGYTITRNSVTHDVTYTYGTDTTGKTALNRMNGYLGSFTGSTTFALVTQEQKHTTDEILQNVQSGVTLGGGSAATSDDKLYVQSAADYAVKPDSTAVGGVSCYPDAEYLKALKSTGSSPDGSADPSASGASGGMSEFAPDFGTNLGSFELAATDYATFVTDGTKIGFAVGLPLGTAGDEDSKKNFKDQNKENWTQFADFFKDFGGQNDSYTNAKNAKNAKKPQKDKAFQSKSFSVEFSLGLAFMFDYNPLDNDYYFDSMVVSASAELSFRMEMRLAVCPIVYLYFEVGASVEIGTGLGVNRKAVDDAALIDGRSETNKANRKTLKYLEIPKNEASEYLITKAEYLKLDTDKLSGYGVGSGDGEGYCYNKTYDSFVDAQTAFQGATEYSFTTTRKAFNICFKGKLSVDVYVNKGTTASPDWQPASDDDSDASNHGFVTGYLNSDGTDITQVVLKQQDGMDLKEKDGTTNKTVKIVLRALDQKTDVVKDATVISYLATIKSVQNDVYWKGVTIDPSVYLELGAGVGVELMKLEVYIKASVEASFILGVYNTGYDPEVEGSEKYKPAIVDSFDFSASVGLRVVLLMFTFELDAAKYSISYDHSSDKWSFGWSFLNDKIAGSSASGEDGGTSGLTVREPVNKEDAQKLFSPEDNAGSTDLSGQAYDPTDAAVPFQLSGYGSSVDAASLGKDFAPGSDYKVVSVGDRNFIVYTITRTGASGLVSEDYSQLVMSELAYQQTIEGSYKYGLVNPADATSKTPYLVLDNAAGAADGTGDLDFSVWTSSNGTTNTVHAAWVSYAEAASATQKADKPDGEAYAYTDSNGTTTMTVENYKTISAPTEVTKPTESSYYAKSGNPISIADYNALTTAQQGCCEALSTDPVTYQLYTLGSGYTSLAAAQSAYQTALGNYTAYVSSKASYDAWYAYFAYEDYTTNRYKNDAANIVLKTSSWSFGATSFADASKVYGDNAAGSVNYLFSPASDGDGSAIFFGGVAKTDASDAAYDKYVAYVDKVDASDPDQMKNYLKSTRKLSLDVYGATSSLNLAYQKSDKSWAVSTVNLTTDAAKAEGQTLDNVEFKKIDDAYYVAYTTRQYVYVGAGTPESPYTDLCTVNRLFLRKVTTGTDGAPVWGDPMLLRTTYDYDKDTEKDGVYNAATGKTDPYDSPYFSSLRFLTGSIDKDKLTGTSEDFSAMSASQHTFLLFEMNGATYMILDDSLKSITTADTTTSKYSGTIYPFFTSTFTKADGETVSQATGKSQVTIGSDGTNVYAVYVGSVPNTTNNALYLSAYDADTGTWGQGVMLAMRYMNTYETALDKGWDNKTAEAAYYGLYDKTTNAAGLTDDGRTKLYGTDEAASLKTALTGINSANLGSMTSLTFSNLQTVKGGKGDLLVVTQGALANLAVAGDSASGYSVIQNGASQLGMYAVSYGKGTQKIGEGSIAFSSADFSAGSKLYTDVSFRNTGDTAIRGSVDQPVTIELSAKEQKIAEWKVKGNIASGQKVSLSSYNDADGSTNCAALAAALTTGDTLTLKVSEDSAYITDKFKGTAYTETLTLFTVKEHPDLSVEGLAFSNPRLSADGRSTTLDVSFTAANRGAKDANGVYVQFSYANGKTDDDGIRQYAVLDLTGSDLTVGQAAELSAQAVAQDKLASGILKIYNETDDNDSLKSNYGRKVTGTITVPSSVFASSASKCLDLKVEIFDDSKMTGSSAGVVESAHTDEYNAGNNASEQRIEAMTAFSTSSRVILPLGSTTLLPVSAVSSRGARPSLYVQEINDTDGLNLGILNFKQTSADASTGAVSGVISITPSKTGTGIIHLYDKDTSQFTAITFEVLDVGSGIDIFNDNDAFSFYNANKTKYDAAAASGTQDWQFNNCASWGTGSSAEVPYRSNVSYGKNGAYFTFSSVAESIDLYFQGTITVESTAAGFRTKAFTGAGGSVPTKISFGSNANKAAFTVTIRVNDANGATFDRLAETYTGGTPLPVFDGVSPAFYWSRSFPDTASIETSSGTKIPMTCYILDNNGLSYLTVDGKQYTTASPAVKQLDGSGLLWSYSFGDISENHSYEISATDVSGNTTSTTFVVDWFNDTAIGNEYTVTAPDATAGFYLDDTPWAGNAIGEDNASKLNIQVSAGTSKTGKPAVQQLSSDKTSFSPLTTASTASPYKYTDIGNGIYLVQTTADDGTWCEQFLVMSAVDSNIPLATLEQDSADPSKLEWSAWKDTSVTAAVSNITKVTLNGQTVSTAAGTTLYGTQNILFNGDYTLSVTDAAGNTVSKTREVKDRAVDISGCTVSPVDSWNQAGTNGSVAVDLSKAVGGKYVSNTVAFSDYSGSYEAAVASVDFDEAAAETKIKTDYAAANEGKTISDADLAAQVEKLRAAAYADSKTKALADTSLTWTSLSSSSGWTHTFKNLKVGGWMLLVRDAQDHVNVTDQAFTIGNSAITALATAMDASGSGESDGKILATLDGGITDGYEFAIQPVSSEQGTTAKDITIDQFLALTPAAAWNVSASPSGSLRTNLFTGLKSGWYYVAVRGVYGATDTQLTALTNALAGVNAAESALTDAKKAQASEQATLVKNALIQATGYYTTWYSLTDAAQKAAAWNTLVAYIGGSAGAPYAAMTAWKDAADTDSSKAALYTAYQNALTTYFKAKAAADTAAAVKTAESDVTAKTAIYTAAADAVTAASAAQYTTGSEYWSGADVALVYVGYRKSSSVSAINTLTTDANGTTVFELSGADATLSDADIAEIYQADQTNNVMLRAGGLSVYIPKKLLTASFDVNRLLTGLTGAADGSIVEYTDLNGKKSVDPWCLVSNGKAQYLVVGLGDYKLVPKSASFSDIDGLWGKDNILFTAVRELFNGTSGDSFSPNVTMSRAMFVTVLWRLDGSPAVTGESGFTDLTQDWYRTAVLWASQNGIVKGYSGTLFGPDDPVSREQMCVFLTRYLAYRSMKLTVKQKATDFSDAAKISSWAKDSVDECTSSGLILGTGANRFTPARDASRMEVSTLFERFIDALVSKYAGA